MAIDYVGAWYYKAAQMIQNTTIRVALVSTNSITQGEQVAPMWKKLFFDYEDASNKWILISERLPEEETKVIVSTNNDIVTTGLYTKRYGFSMKEGFICDSGFRYLHTNEVLAWQPFPESYKEVKE